MIRGKSNLYDNRKLIPTKETKLGDGYYAYNTTDAPADGGDGTPVDQFEGVHVTFYADATTYTGMYARIIPWRWFGEAREGMSAAVPKGRWIADQAVEVALDPALITGVRGSHYVWDTRDCESMYWQIQGFYNADGLTTSYPDWTVIQPYGLTGETVIAALSGVSGGNSGDTGTLATHDSPVIAEGPQVMAEAKAFDGVVLPSDVAEGDAIRASATLYGVGYTFLTNQDGSDTPVVLHDAAILAANGGTAGLMSMREAKNFDGVALPNPVAEADAGRPAATLHGVGYAFLSAADGSGSPIIAHDTAILAANGGTVGVMQAREAKNFDGVALPNPVAENDAGRPAATLHGVGYAFLTNPDGSDTPIILHDTAILAANGGTAGVMQANEAKDYDGVALPNAVAEGDGARPAVTLQGVRYNFLVNEDGSGSPVATDGEVVTNVAGNVTGLLGMGRAISVLPTAVTALDASTLKTDLYGRMMLSSNQLASTSDRGEEINPLDTRDVPSILADGATVAENITTDFYVPMSHMKGLSIQWEPSDANFVLKVYSTNEDNGTALAACNYVDVTNAWFGAATFIADTFLLFDTEMCEYGIHIEVVRADSVGDGTHELFVRRNF